MLREQRTGSALAHSFKRFARGAVAGVALAGLAACGGGGSSTPADTTPTTPTPAEPTPTPAPAEPTPTPAPAEPTPTPMPAEPTPMQPSEIPITPAPGGTGSPSFAFACYTDNVGGIAGDACVEKAFECDSDERRVSQCPRTGAIYLLITSCLQGAGRVQARYFRYIKESHLISPQLALVGSRNACADEGGTFTVHKGGGG